MLTWWEILAVVIIAVALVGIVVSLIRGKIRAKKCGSSCVNCPYASGCRTAHNNINKK